MTQPFCCDITSGTKEEQNEFKRLFEKVSNDEWTFASEYYGFSKLYGWDGLTNSNDLVAIKYFTNILPLSEGILILKKMVGEEEKPDRYKLLKEIMVNELLTWGLSIWKDNGECREYNDLSAEDANNLSDYIISSYINSLQPKP